MNVFELFAKIGLDTSDFENGLGQAGSVASSFGDKLKSGLATAAKVGAAAIGAATTAAVAFAKSSVDTGMQFDAAMSQIAATAGITSNDIENNINGAADAFDLLREKALQSGSDTNYSATEAAEGLNILLMSGYDATEAVAMLDDVLHLAAAGSMDMADAAAYVSGAMKGFNDETKDSAYYADMIAKGATLAATDVSQLGDALSGVSAAATSYGQSAESMEIALLRLAEQQVVGSNASTALAAAMKNLFAPTDQAKKVMQELGVNAFDPATGSARDFNVVVDELNAALSGYTDEQKTAYLQTIYGIQGFDAYNKMVVTSVEKQEEWANALAESSGEAAKQYETMTDNLVGDIDKWNSAVEGFQISLSDQLTPSLREFVQFGTDGISKVSAAFQEGGLSGAMEAFGTILSDGLAMILEDLPSWIDAGMQLLDALGQGIMDNLPLLIDSSVEIIMMLVEGIIDSLPELVTAAVEIIAMLAEGIADDLPELVPTIVDVVMQIVETLIDNVDMLIDAAISITLALADGLIDSMPKLLEKVPGMVVKLVNAIVENAPKLLKAAAKLIAKLAIGITDNLPKIGEAAGKIVSSIVSGIINLIKDIHDVGVDIVNGIWKGISEKVEWLKEKVTGFFKGIVDGVKSFLGISSPSKLFKNEVGGNIVNGLWEGISEKAKWLKEKVTGFFKGVVDGAKDFLGIRSPSKMFRDEVGQYIGLGIAKGIKDTEDKAAKAAENLAKNVYNTSKDWAERQTKYLNLTYDEQIELWEAILSQFVEGSEQYADAEEKIFDLRQQKAKEEANALEEYQKKVESTYDKIDKLEEDYQKALEKRSREIFDSYSLFEQIPEREEISGEKLIDNLLGQLSSIEEFYAGINALAERGVGEDLVEEIRAMGVGASDELTALLSLSDEQLSEYADLFKQKQELANSVALEELSSLREETDKEIKSQMDSIQAIYDEYAPKVGVAFTDGLSLGISNGISKVIETAVNSAKSVVDAVQNVLGIHSPSRVFASIGENMVAGLGKGWNDEYEKVKRQIEYGMDFGFNSLDVNSRDRDLNIGREIVIPITLNLTNDLDGSVLSRKMVRYNARAQSLAGESLVNVSKL